MTQHQELFITRNVCPFVCEQHSADDAFELLEYDRITYRVWRGMGIAFAVLTVILLIVIVIGVVNIGFGLIELVASAIAAFAIVGMTWSFWEMVRSIRVIKKCLVNPAANSIEILSWSRNSKKWISVTSSIADSSCIISRVEIISPGSGPKYSGYCARVHVNDAQFIACVQPRIDQVQLWAEKSPIDFLPWVQDADLILRGTGYCRITK